MLKEVVVVDAHQLGKEEVELEQRLKSCFAADLDDLRPRAGDVVLQELLPLLHTVFPMACEVAVLAEKLLIVNPDRPDCDQKRAFAQIDESPFGKRQRPWTILTPFPLHLLKNKSV